MIDLRVSRDHAMSFFWNSKAVDIDPTKPFRQDLDMTAYVKKVEGGYGCTKCDKTLVKIEPNGILGDRLNQLDAAVAVDHHLRKH